MILGRVVGTVWATRKHPRLTGYKLLIVRPCCWYEPSHRVGHLVAIDVDIDAGIGDDVVVCMGEPPRWKSEGRPMPVDAAIMAVVDRCEIDRGAFQGPRALCRDDTLPRNLSVTNLATPGPRDGGKL